MDLINGVAACDICGRTDDVATEASARGTLIIDLLYMANVISRKRLLEYSRSGVGFADQFRSVCEGCG